MYCDFHKSFDKATCKVFVEALVKSESGDIADVCLCGGFEKSQRTGKTQNDKLSEIS